MHPDDLLHVILDSLDVMLEAIDNGATPWADYDGSFGGDADLPDHLRRDAYLAALAAADTAITARLNASAAL